MFYKVCYIQLNVNFLKISFENSFYVINLNLLILLSILFYHNISTYIMIGFFETNNYINILIIHILLYVLILIVLKLNIDSVLNK